MKLVSWVLRIGVFGTFLGHGLLAIGGKVTWLAYLMHIGISRASAEQILPFIGYLDLIIAFWILLKPNRYVVLWAIFWTLSTALIRPISGEPFLEFIERSANWAVPVALYLIMFKPSFLSDESAK